MIFSDLGGGGLIIFLNDDMIVGWAFLETNIEPCLKLRVCGVRTKFDI